MRGLLLYGGEEGMPDSMKERIIARYPNDTVRIVDIKNSIDDQDVGLRAVRKGICVVRRKMLFHRVCPVAAAVAAKDI